MQQRLPVHHELPPQVLCYALERRRQLFQLQLLPHNNHTLISACSALESTAPRKEPTDPCVKEERYTWSVYLA